MGIVIQQVTFNAPAPTSTPIAAQVTELTGLPVILRNAPPEHRENLYDFMSYIAFESYPGEEIELTAYRTGAVQELLRQSGFDASPIAKLTRGSNEAAGKQTVYLKGYVGQEPTLLFATTLALVSLGGQLDQPMPDEILRDYGGKISSEELQRRYRKVKRQGLLMLAVFVILLPILLPFWIITLGWRFVTFRSRISKQYQLLKMHQANRTPGGSHGDFSSEGPDLPLM